MAEEARAETMKIITSSSRRRRHLNQSQEEGIVGFKKNTLPLPSYRRTKTVPI